MNRQKIVLGGLALTGAGAAAAVCSRQMAARAADFYDSLPEPGVPRGVGQPYGGPPWVAHRSEVIELYHTASLEAIASVLPSPDLHPVRLANGRGIVGIAAAEHTDFPGAEGATPPYAEVLITVAVTRRPAPPLLPIALQGSSGFGAGYFVLHLPVTSVVARDAGRIEWGYPKFIADMEFEESTLDHRLTVSEGGHELLRLTARPSGRPSPWRGNVVCYSSLDGELIEETIPTHGLRQLRFGAAGGRIELGDHQVADELRRLSIAPEPFMTMRLIRAKMAMGVGRAIGPARQYLGYIGADRQFGRYVVRYPNSAPIDRYAAMTESSASSRELAGVPR